MARLGKPVVPPDFGGETFMEEDEKEMDWFDDYRKNHDVIRFPVADGYAFYEVTPARTTLKHIEIGDCYTIPMPYVRGMRKEDVELMLAREKAMNDIFGS